MQQLTGFSTAANYAGYARSTVGAHDHWADLVGDDFWSWDNVYPFYKKSVNFSPPDFTRIESNLNITYDESAYESTGGPLHVSYGNFQGPYGPPLAEALEGQGLDNIQGFSSGKLIGYGTIAAAVDPRTATRSSSETSFLQAAAGGTGLKIYPNTLAKRVVFDGTKATGVEVKANSLTQDFSYTLSARKEVIVSAGVVSLLHSRNRGDKVADYQILVALTPSPHGLWCRTCRDVGCEWHRCRC